MATARNRILDQATNQRSTLYRGLNTPADVHFVTQIHHRNGIKIRPFQPHNHVLSIERNASGMTNEWWNDNWRSNQTIDTKLIICIFLCIDSLGFVFHLCIFISRWSLRNRIRTQFKCHVWICKGRKLSSVHILFPFVPPEALLSFFLQFDGLVPIFLFMQYRTGLTNKRQAVLVLIVGSQDL